MDHSDILKRSLPFLKDNLYVGPILDRLLADGIFSDRERDECKCQKTSQGKADELISKLWKKDSSAYHSFLFALEESNQRHIIDKLIAAGNTEESVLKPGLLEQEEVIKQLRQEHEEYVRENDELRERVNNLETLMERVKLSSEEQLKNQEYELKNERSLRKKAENTCRDQKRQIDDLKRELRDTRETFWSLTDLQRPPGEYTPTELSLNEDFRKQVQAGCIYRTKKCDPTQLHVLPCLHSVCKPCLKLKQTTGGILHCACNRTLNANSHLTKPDHVRINEAAFEAFKQGNRQCNFSRKALHFERAVFYCQNCDNYLCRECRKLHDSISNNRGCQVTDVKKIPMQTWLSEKTCRDHRGQFLSMYDLDCKKSICDHCSTWKHRQHRKKNLEGIHTERDYELRQMEAVVRKQQEHVEQCIQSSRQKDKDLHDTEVYLYTATRTIFEDLARTLIRREKSIQEEISAKLQRPKDLVKERFKKLFLDKMAMETSVDYIARARRATRRSEFMNLWEIMSEKLKRDLQLTFEEPKLPDDTQVIFPELHVQAIKESIGSFGDVVVSQDNDPPHHTEIINTRKKKLDIRKEDTTCLPAESSEVVCLQERCQSLQNGLPHPFCWITSAGSKKEYLLLCPVLKSCTVQDDEIVRNINGGCKLRHAIASCVHEETSAGSTTVINLECNQRPHSSPTTRTATALLNFVEACISALPSLSSKTSKSKNPPSSVSRPVKGHRRSRSDQFMIKDSKNTQKRPRCLSDSDFRNETRISAEEDLVENKFESSSEKSSEEAPAHKETEIDETKKHLAPFCTLNPSGVHSASKYWEVSTTVELKESVCFGPPLFEVGLYQYNNRGVDNRYWKISVYMTSMLTSMILEWNESSRCLEESVPQQEQSSVFHFGIIVNAVTGRIGFIDLRTNRVLTVIQETFRGSLYPSFGISPHHGTTCCVDMKLITGEDIKMTREKEHLIFEVLDKDQDFLKTYPQGQ